MKIEYGVGWVERSDGSVEFASVGAYVQEIERLRNLVQESEAAQRVAALMTKAAGDHAETVVVLRAEVERLTRELAEARGDNDTRPERKVLLFEVDRLRDANERLRAALGTIRDHGMSSPRTFSVQTAIDALGPRGAP